MAKNTKKQTSIELDVATQKALDELKMVLGVNTNAAVIRRSIALTRFMASQAGEDHMVSIQGTGKEKTNLVIAT